MSDPADLVTGASDTVVKGGLGMVLLVGLQRIFGFVRSLRAESARDAAEKARDAAIKAIGETLKEMRAEQRIKDQADAGRHAAFTEQLASMQKRIDGGFAHHGQKHDRLSSETLQRLTRLETKADLPQWQSTPSGVVANE